MLKLFLNTSLRSPSMSMSLFLPFFASSISTHDSKPVQSETSATLPSVMTAVKNSCRRSAGVGGASLRDEVMLRLSLEVDHVTR